MLRHRLRATLIRLEQTEDLSPDDPTLLELKHSIPRAIANLEIVRLGRSTAA